MVSPTFEWLIEVSTLQSKYYETSRNFYSFGFSADAMRHFVAGTGLAILQSFFWLIVDRDARIGEC